jgi:pimeloyl-ACP methyl ester carboxylesterase
MKPVSRRFEGTGGVRIAGDAYGDPGKPGILLAHGGGQTRHAWGSTARDLAARGWYAVTVDQRGHGDSDWSPEGDYHLVTYATDLLNIADGFRAPPAMVGASLGGLAGIIAQGELVPEDGRQGFSALVLVDVTPRVEQEGVDHIRGFMAQNMVEGFATLEEAAASIAAFLPHRPPPKNLEGLKKNLRLGPDRRYRWHWDPRFISERGQRSFTQEYTSRLLAAAQRLTLPTLLVRGGLSDVVSKARAAEFMELVPHARYADIAGAGHMVAGDQNDAFSGAVIEFLDAMRQAAAVRAFHG